MIYESQQDAQHEKKRLHTGDKKIQTRDSAVFGSGRDCSVRLRNVLYGGRYSGRLNVPAAGSSEGGAVETTSQYIDLAPGSPSFLFPPGAACRDATPSNADMMDSQVLNLAYLYEDGADSTDPADSYAGRLYDLLALKDASWISGLYDLYNYTPQQLAALLGLPETAVTSTSGIIPEFRNISVHFVNSEQQETGSTSNAREIISIINTLHYFGILKDMKTMEDCADKLWNASHKYSVRIGGIYYCDGSCLDETADGRKDADESGAEAAGAQTAGVETADAVIAGSEAAGTETAGAETVGTAAAGTEAVESGAAVGEPVGSMAASAAAEAETAAVASFSDASSIVSGASDTGPADSSPDLSGPCGLYGTGRGQRHCRGRQSIPGSRYTGSCQVFRLDRLECGYQKHGRRAACPGLVPGIWSLYS